MPDFLDPVIAFLWAFLISVFAIPSIIQVAYSKNILDQPNDRTIHKDLTPRLGGLAIFAGFLSALTLFATINPTMQRFLAALVVLVFIGLKDDITEVSAFKKFFVQVLATGIVVFMADIRITSFQGFLGMEALPDGFSYAFSFLVIVGLTNAINLIDGLDGLAGTIAVLISALFGSYFFLYGGKEFFVYATAAAAICGGLMGFLRYNIYRAIIFMGDTGSLVSGFICAVLAIEFIEMARIKAVIDSAPSLALGALVIPIFDTLRVFARRIIQGRSPFSPDKSHLHHILLGQGLSQLQTLAVLALANLGIFFLLWFLRGLGDNLLILIYSGLFLFSSLLMEYLARRKTARGIEELKTKAPAHP